MRKGGKSVDSDHRVFKMDLDLKIIPTRPTRSILYNFKSSQGRYIFRNLISETKDFTSCFNSMQPLQYQCEKWKDVLQSYCKHSIPKIRLKTRKTVGSVVDSLIDKRNRLKLHNVENKNNVIIKKIEEDIANVLSEEGSLKTLCTKWIREYGAYVEF